MSGNLQVPCDPLVEELTLRLAQGEYAVSKLATMAYFTVIDGEFADVVVDDVLRGAIQRLAGVPLVEYVDERYGSEVGLRFAEEDLQLARTSIETAMASASERAAA